MKKSKKEVKKEKQALQPISTFQSADMILTGLAGKDVNLDKLEKLLEIKGKFEAEENRKLFQIKFAELQSELPIIKKTKEVYTKKGSKMYTYAPLEKIIEQIKPILKKYNFSYKWSEGLTEREGYKRIYCHIMACGHTESSFVDIPIMSANDYINSAQQAGSSSTYGKRYSLIGALGIMADEDDDGQSLNESQKNIKQTPAEELEAQDHTEINAKLKDILIKLHWNQKKFCEYIDFTMGIKDHTKLNVIQKEKIHLLLKDEYNEINKKKNDEKKVTDILSDLENADTNEPFFKEVKK